MVQWAEQHPKHGSVNNLGAAETCIKVIKNICTSGVMAKLGGQFSGAMIE